MVVLLLVLNSFSLLSDGSLNCDGRGGGEGPGTTSCCSDAGTAAPNAHGSSLHLGFATEGAGVLGTLAGSHFFHHFPEGGAIRGPIFAHDSDLLGAFRQVATT